MLDESVEILMQFESMPFHVGFAECPANGRALPDALPFAVGWLPRLGLLVQAPSGATRHALESAYRDGSTTGTPLAAEGLGRAYADDFCDFIGAVPVASDGRALRVLEFGCGTGYLLRRLVSMGHEVLGVEPGRQGQVAAQEHGVEVICGSFPNDIAISRGPFDLVVSHCVLEHIEDPLACLAAAADCLADNGMVVVAVPDCSTAIAVGDISMFAHEHMSYFSDESLVATVSGAGLRVETMRRSSVGDTLMCAAVPSAGEEPGSEVITRSLGYSFSARVSSALEATRTFFDVRADEGLTAGVFCAGRLANALHIEPPRRLPRFFDDDPRLTGKFYPPLPVRMEDRTSLITNPVDSLLIASRAFGSSIDAGLRRDGLPAWVETVQLAELLVEPDAGLFAIADCAANREGMGAPCGPNDAPVPPAGE